MPQSKMFRAQAIQYLRPNGRQKAIYCQLPSSVEHFYRDMKVRGYRLEIEELTTGFVSATISDGSRDVDISLTPNNHLIQDGIVAMLERVAWRSQRVLQD